MTTATPVIICAILCVLVICDAVWAGDAVHGDGVNIVKRDAPKNKKQKKPSAADEVRNDPDKFLEKFGYLGKMPPGQIQRDPATRRRAIKAMQRMYGLPQTGEMNKKTLDAMTRKRCGMPDTKPVGTQLDPRAPQQFYAPGYKWEKTNLKWRTDNYSPDMYWGHQKKAFQDALKLWSEVTPLRFEEIRRGEADIEIQFGSYDHGDGYTFDGEGMVLAHAFYPDNGDTHFDESETWSEKGEGTNLMIVAAHEFGHALGLGHSNVQSALMAPTYAGYQPNYKLDRDDILAIQSLYGSAAPPPTPRPPRPTRPVVPARTRPPVYPRTTKKPSTKPQLCDTKFDAILQAGDGRIYVFRNEWLFRLHYWGVETSTRFPQLIRKHFNAPPKNIAAATYSWRTRYTYFFKSDRVWKYDRSTRVARKTIKQPGYPKGITAALAGRDGNIYLFAGTKYYIFDEARMRVQSTSGRLISSKWPGIPAAPEAAIRLSDGYLYFFKGLKYRKFDEANSRVMSGYPKSSAGPWMGPKCSKSGGYEHK